MEKALTFSPDLISLIAGANDVLKGRWNHQEYKNDMEFMIDTLSKADADIIIGNLQILQLGFLYHLKSK